MSGKLTKIGSLLLVVVVLSSLTFVSYQFYGDVITRANAIRGSVSMLGDSIKNLVDPEGNVVSWVYGGETYTLQLNGGLSTARSYSDVNSSWLENTIRHIQGCTVQCASYSTLADRLVSSLYDQQQSLQAKGLEVKGTSFEALSTIVKELQNTTLQIQQTTNDLVNLSNAAKTGGENEFSALKVKGIELIAYYYQAEAQTNDALNAMPATGVNLLAPFVLITVVFSIFLLLPCILLLQFFLQKEEKISRAKNDIITRLNLRTKNAGNIRIRSFHFSEYFVSIIFLTLLNATLLYFFFYPNATSGLAQLISNGGGIRAFADYLVADSTTITFGFMGAYFYIMQMLIRRYFSSDLTPYVYSQAVVRILGVFILSVVLQTISSALDIAQLPIAIAAFVIGIFPEVGLRWIVKSANSLIKNLGAPELMDKDPLTKIDGLNTWHEARLLEEKIDNIHNLASAPIEMLILNTNFYPMQLFSWVDQAVLYTHAGGYWIGSFKKVGINSATGLIETIGEGNSSLHKIEELTKAINDVQSANPIESEKSADRRGNTALKQGPLMTKEILSSIITNIKANRALTDLNKWKEFNDKVD